MGRRALLLAALAVMVTLAGCDLFVPTNDTSILPSFYNNRPVEYQGQVSVSNRQVTIYAWDGGNLVDGDIVTIEVNGTVLFDNYELTGSRVGRDITLDYNGYNYILLYAHNEGTSPPNTASIAIDDGAANQDLVMSANLAVNAGVDIFVGSGSAFVP
jgi:hypothetical protein